MKAQRNTDHALREALKRLAQQQPAPPEGMTERFMARLAKEQTAKAAGTATRRGTTSVLHRLWLPVATAAAVVLAFVLWTDDTNTETKQPIVAEVQHPTKPAIPSSQPNPVKVPAALTPEDTASLPATIHKPSARTLTISPQPTPSSAPNKPATVLDKSAASTIVTSHDNQPIAQLQPPAEDIPTPATPTTNPSPPSVRPETYFTDAERELDRRAMQAGGQYGYLIAGEAIALARISLREHLAASFTHIKHHSTKPAKPIAI